MTLADASTPAADHLDIAAGWRQGRGAFGGLVVAALIRAIERAVGDPKRRARSVTAELPGAVEPGRAEIAVDILRAGNAVTTARASLSQAGEIRTHAVAIVAADRLVDAPIWQDLPRPVASSWREVEPLPWSPAYPEFAQHFEYRIVEGAIGAKGAAQALGWIRAREPGVARDAGYVAAMADAWWPAALHRFAAMRPIATIAYTLEVIADPSTLDPAVPLLYRAVVPVCGNGYFIETRELWTEAGELVAINHQTFAVIK
jgi:acyl-CoA thioesterase